MDPETRRRKQQVLMLDLLEKKIRLRAQQLYESRKEEDGTALGDWVRAEREILENSILASLYKRNRPEAELCD